jgi:hypothetical protein
VFRAREQFVNHRTEAINALRSHLYEFGYVAPQGSAICRASRKSSRIRTRTCRGSPAISGASCWSILPNEILRKASAYFAQAEFDRRFKP